MESPIWRLFPHPLFLHKPEYLASIRWVALATSPPVRAAPTRAIARAWLLEESARGLHIDPGMTTNQKLEALAAEIAAKTGCPIEVARIAVKAFLRASKSTVEQVLRDAKAVR